MEWPFGTYTLVKPKSGCPPNWSEGWTKQDDEDSHNRNSLSYGHHFFGMHNHYNLQNFSKTETIKISIDSFTKCLKGKTERDIYIWGLLILIRFIGSFGRNFQFFYCTRNPNEFSSRRYWPAGNYCILKQGRSCPSGIISMPLVFKTKYLKNIH